MAKSRWARFRLATFFIFAFGFAVGLVWDNYSSVFLAMLNRPSNPTDIFYTGGVLPSRELLLTKGLSVKDAIAMFGGLGSQADKSNVKIIRQNVDGSQSEIIVDITNPMEDLHLRSGDLVLVHDYTQHSPQ